MSFKTRRGSASILVWQFTLLRGRSRGLSEREADLKASSMQNKPVTCGVQWFSEWSLHQQHENLLECKFFKPQPRPMQSDTGAGVSV